MSKTKILIAEYNSFVLKLLKHVLLSINYEDITFSPDAKEAMGILNRNQIDLVISDVLMPHIHGLH